MILDDNVCLWDALYPGRVTAVEAVIIALPTRCALHVGTRQVVEVPDGVLVQIRGGDYPMTVAEMSIWHTNAQERERLEFYMEKI